MADVDMILIFHGWLRLPFLSLFGVEWQLQPPTNAHASTLHLFGFLLLLFFLIKYGIKPKKLLGYEISYWDMKSLDRKSYQVISSRLLIMEPIVFNL